MQLSGATTKASVIADEIREWVASGRLPQGSRLHQDELADRFGTSITPVREALRELRAEGLVESRPYRSAVVASPDLEQIASIYVMRRLIEPYAACRASSRLTRRDFDHARELNEQFAAAQERRETSEARVLNYELHFLLYDACEMPTLVAEIRRLWSAYGWANLQAEHTVLMKNSPSEHSAMIDAMVADDQETIQELFEHHIRAGYLGLTQQFDGTVSDPFEM